MFNQIMEDLNVGDHAMKDENFIQSLLGPLNCMA